MKMNWSLCKRCEYFTVSVPEQYVFCLARAMEEEFSEGDCLKSLLNRSDFIPPENCPYILEQIMEL